MDVREQVRQIIAQQMGVELVFDHETFAELGADVIDCLYIGIDTENLLGITLPDTVGKYLTVGEFLDEVEHLL